MESVDDAVTPHEVRDYTIDSVMSEDCAVKSIKRHLMRKLPPDMPYRKRLYKAGEGVLQVVKNYESQYK
jgi:hypothetical protein